MSEAEDVDWTLVGYVTASDYRSRILGALAEGPATPTTIGERTGLNLTHVSRTLTELREHDAVELLVPEDTHKGRIYGLTDDGEAAAVHAQGVDA